jgi:putative spermidine/putrescine transport system substrate-binding protein
MVRRDPHPTSTGQTSVTAADTQTRFVSTKGDSPMKEPNDSSSGKKLSRRDALAAGGAAVGALALGADPVRAAATAPRRRRATPVTVKMFVFLGGALEVMPRKFKEWYERNNPNVSIEIYANSNTVGYPLMVAAKRQNPEQPFVNLGFFNAQTSAQGDLDDMWQVLDYGALKNAKDILPVFKRANRKGIGIGADQLGLVYNRNGVRRVPRSWRDLWHEDYAGQVTFFDYYWQAVYAAARMNGGDLRRMTPGWNLWRQRAKQQIRAIVTSNPQYVQVLTNGTASLTSYFLGTATQWIRQGAPLAYVVPAEGAINVPVYLQSVKGNTSQQSEACLDIIDKMLSPTWCGGWMNTTIEVPANSKVKLPAEFSRMPGFQKRTIDRLWKPNYQVVAKAIATWRRQWDQEIKARI